MSDLVNPSKIEHLVGRSRHPLYHFARADSETGTVFILHSQECKDSGIDLRECKYSLALDRGIRSFEWRDHEDQPELVVVRDGWLVPAQYVVPGPRERLTVGYGPRRVHVLRQRNYKVYSSDWAGYGMWTRMGVDSQALCGSMRYSIAGLDVADWAVEHRPIDLEGITCVRCRERYGRRLAKMKESSS